MAEYDYMERALEQLLQERSELDAAITILQKRIGKPSVGASPTSPEARLQQPSSSVVTYRGEFFNLSITKAAEKLLKRVGRPMKTPEIQAAFEQAGYEIKSKLIRPTIYTSLTRSRDFVKVLPDTWDLSERHPEAAAKKEHELTAARTSKAKKIRKAAKAEIRAVAEVQKVA